MARSKSTAGPLRGRFSIFDQPYLLCSLTMLFWSGNVLISRATVGEVPPVALAQMRWTLAFLILLPFAAAHIRRDWPVIVRRWKVLTVLSLLGIAVYNTFLYIGVQTTSAVNASMLSSLFPMVIAATGFILYRDRLTAMQFVGILVACAGAATILSHGSLSALRGFVFVVGDLWIIGSQLAYSLYTVLLRERPAMHHLTFVTVTIFIGQLALWPFTLAEWRGGDAVTLDWVTVGTVLYVAIFPAVLAYVCFNRAVQLMGSNRTAPFFHLIAVFTSIGAVTLLGEHVAPYHLVGWGLILAGIAATQMFAGKSSVRESRSSNPGRESSGR